MNLLSAELTLPSKWLIIIESEDAAENQTVTVRQHCRRYNPFYINANLYCLSKEREPLSIYQYVHGRVNAAEESLCPKRAKGLYSGLLLSQTPVIHTTA